MGVAHAILLARSPPPARNHGFWEEEQLGNQGESCPTAPSWKAAKKMVQ